MIKLLCGLVILLGLSSCANETTTQPPSDPYERWTSLHLQTYSIEQTRTCYCPLGAQPMRVAVVSGAVASVTRISDGTTLTPAEAQAYLTVDSLFSIIRHNTSDSIVVRYHSTYGYPEYLDINPQLHPVDGGVLFTLSGLKPL
jgi:hypothetical protein